MGVGVGVQVGWGCRWGGVGVQVGWGCRWGGVGVQVVVLAAHACPQNETTLAGGHLKHAMHCSGLDAAAPLCQDECMHAGTALHAGVLSLMAACWQLVCQH